MINITEERKWQGGEENPLPYAMKLHLELDMGGVTDDNEMMNLLRRYSHVQNGISRDFIIPGDMTLHALHFAINRAFGWQNSHLHSFQPYEKEFAETVNPDTFARWRQLCGLYYRFPSEDFEDLYWDDDYKDGTAYDRWVRRKYTGPYYYGGKNELYDECQNAVAAFIQKYPSFEIHKPRNWQDQDYKKLNQLPETEQKAALGCKTVATDDLTMEQMRTTIDLGGPLCDLIERLCVADLLVPADCQPSLQKWEADCQQAIADCHTATHSHTPLTYPYFKELRYQYDYGDGWEVKITCLQIWADRPSYQQAGYAVKTLAARRPVCVAADGMGMMDDVGGIGGYCSFLQQLHDGSRQEIAEMSEWAEMQGYAGKYIEPADIL